QRCPQGEGRDHQAVAEEESGPDPGDQARIAHGVLWQLGLAQARQALNQWRAVDQRQAEQRQQHQVQQNRIPAQQGGLTGQPEQCAEGQCCRGHPLAAGSVALAQCTGQPQAAKQYGEQAWRQVLHAVVHGERVEQSCHDQQQAQQATHVGQSWAGAALTTWKTASTTSPTVRTALNSSAAIFLPVWRLMWSIRSTASMLSISRS